MTSDPTSALAAPASRSRRSLAVGLLTAAIWFLLDQATKEVANQLLQPAGRKIEMPGPMTWQLVYNPGGAFGFGAPRWFFLVVTVIVTLWVLRTLPSVANDLQALAFGLLLAGAIGNATDRVLRANERVIDFIASDLWPTFNVADIAISIGFVLLVIQLLTEKDDAEEPR